MASRVEAQHGHDPIRPHEHKRSKSGIHIKESHKGRLHAKLGVPEGEPIPESKLEAAKHSSSAAERKEATFAENAKHWHHG